MPTNLSTSADEYRQQLQKLAPQGIAWPTEPTSNWVKFLDALAQEFARVDARANELIDESFPDTTTELLPNWERVAGLPDDCNGVIGETYQIRRLNLLAKLAARGGQSIAYFIEVMGVLGFTITITEYDRFRVNRNRMGDALNGEDWEYTFTVNAPTETIFWFRAGQAAAGEPLASWGNERLECNMNKLKPAHTLALFAYG